MFEITGLKQISLRIYYIQNSDIIEENRGRIESQSRFLKKKLDFERFLLIIEFGKFQETKISERSSDPGFTRIEIIN